MMDEIAPEVRPVGLPGWVPAAAQLYLSHIEDGWTIRALARSCGCHASTVSRRIRRYEERRDDPLIDAALRALARSAVPVAETETDEDILRMHESETSETSLPEADLVAREARRILPRLAEPGTVLAVSTQMATAAVLRETEDGEAMRVAVTDRSVAEAFALNDWIACRKPGQVARYRITTAGRSALRRLCTETAEPGLAEAQTPFVVQHRDMETHGVPGGEEYAAAGVRYNAAESPVTALSRRKDKDGSPFLSPDLVAAGERLREDFELAQMGPQVAQNWDNFLTGGVRRGGVGAGVGEGPGAARDRVGAALSDLGPGLGDVALRCVCFMEGMEVVEKQLGWSARSGKIVLRIALMRLHKHYQALGGAMTRMIG